MGRGKKRVESDVMVVGPSHRSGEAGEAEEAFPRLPYEQAWQAEARAAQCRQACRRVSTLVRDELGVNSTTLSGMVAWLLSSRPATVLGRRLPAAVMESHMGATVDRSVYHPQLRAALRDQCALGVVVPVSSSECAVPTQALALVGAALWKALVASQRDARARKSRSEREVVPVDPRPPPSAHVLQTVAAVAQEWRREAGTRGDEEPPVQVMLLMEDFASCDRRALRSLFRCLAEAQHTEEWCRVSLSFTVVLWASAEAELEAGLLDHLFWTRYPFLPAAAMLKNVLCAALMDTHLPFLLPASVYCWIVRHFAEESHSLAWLLHVLQTVIVHFYSTTPGAWVHVRHGCAPPEGFEEELARMFPALRPGPAAARGTTVLQLWRQKLEEFEQYRKRRMYAFTHLWRLLLIWNPDKTKPLLEEYGYYLSLSNAAGGSVHYEQHVRSNVILDVIKLGDEAEMQRRSDAVLEELRKLVAENGEQHAWLAKALAASELTNEPPAAAADAAASSPAAVVAAAPAPEREYVLRKPKDLLLEPSVRSNPNVRAGAVARSNLRKDKAAVTPPLSNDCKVRAMLSCVAVLFAELKEPTEARMPLLKVSMYAGSEHELPPMLWGDHRRQVQQQLGQPSLNCSCCKSESVFKRSKSSSNLSLASGATHEDVCVAFSFPGYGKVDFNAWEKHFATHLGPSVEAGQVKNRFHRAVRDLQCMGLASFSANSAFLLKSDY